MNFFFLALAMDSVIRQVGQGLLRPNYEGLPINVHHTKLLGMSLSGDFS